MKKNFQVCEHCPYYITCEADCDTYCPHKRNMDDIKKFFSITEPFRIERADLAAFAMLINVVLVMTIGFPASWFGLSVAVIGMIIDFTKRSHINCLVMRLSAIVLNIYFLSLYYG